MCTRGREPAARGVSVQALRFNEESKHPNSEGNEPEYYYVGVGQLKPGVLAVNDAPYALDSERDPLTPQSPLIAFCERGEVRSALVPPLVPRRPDSPGLQRCLATQQHPLRGV